MSLREENTRCGDRDRPTVEKGPTAARDSNRPIERSSFWKIHRRKSVEIFANLWKTSGFSKVEMKNIKEKNFDCTIFPLFQFVPTISNIARIPCISVSLYLNLYLCISIQFYFNSFYSYFLS